MIEGAGKRTKPDCRKYFDNARGSAMESGAAMYVCYVCNVMKLVDEKRVRNAKKLLHRIVSMLTKLSRS